MTAAPSRRALLGRVALLIALGALAVVLGWRATRRVGEQRSAAAVCEAARRGDWPAALAASEERWGGGAAAADLGDDPALHLDGAACRCAALMESGRRSECEALLEGLLALPEAGGWLPGPPLTAVAVESLRDRGDLTTAARLAGRGAERYPESFVLAYLELTLRARLGDEGPALAEIAARLPRAGEAAPRLRLRLAERHLAREEWAVAEELLGAEPPAGELAPLWYRLRVTQLAGGGRADELRRHLADWEAAGGSPAEIAARYALVVSKYQLPVPESSIALLRAALADAGRLEDPALERQLYGRLIGHLVVEGRREEAFAAHDAAVARLGALPGLSRDDLERAAAAGSPRGLVEERTAAGELRFTIEGAEPGDRLLLSPPPDAPADDPYQELEPTAAGRLAVERPLGATPQRWVLRDAAGRVRGSGTAWPREAGSTEVAVSRRPPREPLSSRPPARRAGDGRPRVVAVLLDCGDWRLVRHLEARGELPVLSGLLAAGRRAVLDSDPPFTAVALNALARPAAHGVTSFAGLLHQLGGEVAALNFVGVNPAAGLAWVLPGEEDLFSAVGAGPRVAANLLRSFGPVQIGRQAELTGPWGRVRRVEGFRGARPPGPAELERFPRLAGQGVPAALIEEVAADLDNAAALAADPEVDLALLRVAAFDILTHALYPDLVRPGQEDGEAPLWEIYRYVDARLADVDRALDEDDLLIVMSDHGISTAFEHDRQALFVVAGGGVPPGRVPGRPELRGVGRLLAELVGVETAWPDTGVGDWLDGETFAPPAPS